MHIHTSEDPKDGYMIDYNAKNLVREAANRGYDVLAITLHEKLFVPDKDLVKFAEESGVLLIAGVEALIEGKEVLLYNIGQERYDRINKLADLRYLPDDVLVCAPHPYFVHPKCLGDKLVEYIKCFDAIEFCHFYVRGLNLNKKAEQVAKRYGKTLLGNSDSHGLEQFETTYSLIDSKKDVRSVIRAIKSGECYVRSRPLNYFAFLKQTAKFLFPVRKFYKK